MTASIEATTGPAKPIRRNRWQFAFSTLLVGMFVFAIFFGYSGWWWQRLVKARREYDLRLHQLEMALDEQTLVNQRLKSQTQILQSQLKDSIEVRFGEELSGRVTAESDLQEVGIAYAKLQKSYEDLARERQTLEKQLSVANQRLSEAEQALAELTSDRDASERSR